MLKVFIPSYKRDQAIRSHLLFDGSNFDYKIIVHDPAQLYLYKQNKTIPPERLICSYAPYSISHQRQWIKDNLAPENDWWCMADDNIRNFLIVREPEYWHEDLELLNPMAFRKNDLAFKKQVYEQEASQEYLLKVINDTTVKADAIGAKYCAFASNKNYFFARARKWSYYSYAISKFAMYRNDDIAFDTNVQAMDDYCFTAANILKYGKVLVNKFAFAQGGHYQKGGIGRYEERQVKKIADAAYLMLKYPRLFRYKIKKNCHPEAELMIRFCYEKQVEAWRKEMNEIA